MVQRPWKTTWRFLKNLNTELPCDPAIPLLGTYPKEMRAPVFTAALITMAKRRKQLKCPLMDKDGVVRRWPMCSLQKEGLSDALGSLDAPRGRHAKGN